jgi:integrase
VAQQGRSFIDLDRGIYYRLAQGMQATNKRQPPVPIPPRLLAHLRRWHEKGTAKQHFVEFNGQPVKSVKTAFKTAVSLSNLPGKISPHTLRHTAATWLMQIGVSTWEAAGFLGMSEKTLRDVYGHHHPDYLHRAANAIGTKKPVSLVNSLVRPTRRRLQPSQPFENIGGPGSTHIQPINASPFNAMGRYE